MGDCFEIRETEAYCTKRIDEIDRDLKYVSTIKEENLSFHNVKDEPFDLYGFYSTNKEELFLRMPTETAAAIHSNIELLCKHTSGSRVRFKTNSPYVAISVKYPDITRMNHMSLLGSTGFDMYI